MADQTLRKEIDACWDNADWNVSAQRIETLIAAQLSQAVAEAQSAAIEAAARLVCKYCAEGETIEQQQSGTFAHRCPNGSWLGCKAASIRALSTEAIDAAQAARDKRIRAETPRLQRQKVVMDWCVKAFGNEQSKSLPQRCIRLLEESIEAYQSVGCDEDMAHKLVSYVFSRPTGEIAQELGGVGLVLLSIAEAANLDADALEQVEVERVLSKPLEHFTKRNLNKNEAGFAAARKETP